MRDPIDIGNDRQLFVDDFWVDSTDGASRRLHPPTARETAIGIDKPWERGGVSYLNTFPDEGKYRGWYRCDPVGFRGSDASSFTAYAESDDGIHWRKPHQGVLEFEGSKDNNLVWMGPGINLAPFRDDNPSREGRRAVQGHCAGEPGAVRHSVSRRHPLEEDARGANPDRVAIR